MTYLIAGLIIFLGLHSTRIVADDWRTQRITSMGEGAWKGLYSLLSVASFVLLVYGYGVARQSPVDLWVPPYWLYHVTAFLTLPVFVLLAAAYVPGTFIKEKLKHPMLLGVKLWAGAHLLSNGRLADVLLFGGFLLWAALCFRASRMRDRQQGKTYPHVGVSRDVIAVVVGLIVWFGFAFYGHQWLIGVQPIVLN